MESVLGDTGRQSRGRPWRTSRTISECNVEERKETSREPVHGMECKYSGPLGTCRIRIENTAHENDNASGDDKIGDPIIRGHN